MMINLNKMIIKKSKEQKLEINLIKMTIKESKEQRLNKINLL